MRSPIELQPSAARAAVLTGALGIGALSLAIGCGESGERLTTRTAAAEAACDAPAGELPIGLVAEQPAEGPFVKTDRGYMVPYTATIPGTDVTLEMVPVPGGTFRIGSPEGERGREEDEGPQFTVRVEPFWMGKYEVTWGQLRPLMQTYELFVKLSAQSPDHPQLAKEYDDVDAVTTPTRLWQADFNYRHGEDPQLPAATVTQFTAKQYTKWLSGLSGDFYRLPTEAEWEYACRAGTTTAYHFGDDPEKLGEYAWFSGNSDDKTHFVGQKKPNPWGLYDMHGNVMEWVLDQYDAKSYARFNGREVAALDAVMWPTKLESRVLRGGSYYGLPEELRSAARFESVDAEWLTSDPNAPPASPWYYDTDEALEVGFRIIRPLVPPLPKDRGRFWNPDVDDLRWIPKARWTSKGGGLLRANRALPEIMKQLEQEQDAPASGKDSPQ